MNEIQEEWAFQLKPDDALRIYEEDFYWFRPKFGKNTYLYCWTLHISFHRLNTAHVKSYDNI